MDSSNELDDLRSRDVSLHSWLDDILKQSTMGVSQPNIEGKVSQLLSSIQIKLEEVSSSIEEQENLLMNAFPSVKCKITETQTVLKNINLTKISKAPSDNMSAYGRISSLETARHNLTLGSRIIRELQQWDSRIHDISVMISEGRAIQASQLVIELYKLAGFLQKSMQTSADTSSGYTNASTMLSGRRSELFRVASEVRKELTDKLEQLFTSSYSGFIDSHTLQSECRLLIERLMSIGEAAGNLTAIQSSNNSSHQLHHSLNLDGIESEIVEVVINGLVKLVHKIWADVIGRRAEQNVIKNETTKRDSISHTSGKNETDFDEQSYKESLHRNFVDSEVVPSTGDFDANPTMKKDPAATAVPSSDNNLSDEDVAVLFMQRVSNSLSLCFSSLSIIRLTITTAAVSALSPEVSSSPSIFLHGSANSPKFAPDVIVRRVLVEAIKIWQEQLISAKLESKDFSAATSLQDAAQHCARLFEICEAASHALATSRLNFEVPHIWLRTCESIFMSPVNLLERFISLEVSRLMQSLADSPPPLVKNSPPLQTIVDLETCCVRSLNRLSARLEVLLSAPFKFPSVLVYGVVGGFNTQLTTWWSRWSPTSEVLAKNALMRPTVDRTLLHAACKLRSAFQITSLKFSEIDSACKSWISDIISIQNNGSAISTRLLEDSPTAANSVASKDHFQAGALSVALNGVPCDVLGEKWSQVAANIKDKADSFLLSGALVLSDQDISVGPRDQGLSDGAQNLVISSSMILEQAAAESTRQKSKINQVVAMCACSTILNGIRQLFSAASIMNLKQSTSKIEGPRDIVHTTTESLMEIPSLLSECQLKPEFLAEVLRSVTAVIADTSINQIKLIPRIPKYAVGQVLIDLLFVWRIAESTLVPVQDHSVLISLSAMAQGLREKADPQRLTEKEVNELIADLPQPPSAALQSIREVLNSRISKE